MGSRQSPMAVKAAIFIAVRDRLAESNLSDAAFADLISKEIGVSITTAQLTYYRITAGIASHAERNAIARREREAKAAVERAARAEERRIAAAQVSERQQARQAQAQQARHVNIDERLDHFVAEVQKILDSRLTEKSRTFNIATNNLWSKLEEHEKRVTKYEERIRILEGRVIRLETQARAVSGTLPNGWKIVDNTGAEVERVSDTQSNGAAQSP